MSWNRKMTRGWIMTVSVVVGVWLQSPSPSAALTSRRAADESLRTWLTPASEPTAEAGAAASDEPLRAVARFYRQIGLQPVWIGPEGLLPQGKILLDAMAEASEAGLFPQTARFPATEALTTEAISLDRAPFGSELAPHIQWDVKLTHAVLRLAHHLSRGWVSPETLDRQWLALRRPATGSIPEELAAALNQNRLAAYLESLHPSHRAYQALKRALLDHSHLQRAGGWPAIASGPALRLGDEGSRVDALKRRLSLTGDLPSTASAPPSRFDQSVESAVKNFQERHGLIADGVAGRRTIAALNVSIDERIAQLQLNMERWRWFPDSLGERYILVNIPAFELSIIEAQAPITRMRAIVGQKARPTPVMSDRMTYLEFNPYWNIPRKIIRQDILPRAIADPTYLSRNGIRVLDGWQHPARELDPMQIAWPAFASRPFPYRLRQDPSDLNALGRVKFMFPNDLSIYIHDTPGKALFDQEKRIFSSGCVRVEEPLLLAHHLLSSQGWSRAKLDDAIASRQRRTVVLNRPIPVHLVYFTAWVDADERVHFREDVYGQDPPLLKALNQDGSEPILWVKNAWKDHLAASGGIGADRALSVARPGPAHLHSVATSTPATDRETAGS